MTNPETTVLARVKWYAALIEQNITHRLIAAMSIFALWAGVVILAVQPLREMNKAATEYLEHQELSRAQLVEKASKVSNSARDNHAEAFPSADRKNNQLTELFSLIAKQGISLERVDYKSEYVAEASVEKFGVSVAMLGDISSQRRLIGLIRSNLENAAIVAISYDRDRGSDNRFASKMDIIFYYGTGDIPR